MNWVIGSTRLVTARGAACVLALSLAGCTLVVQDTRAPGSPAPFTQAAMRSCPVSHPNLSTSPDPHYIPTTNGFGNAGATIFTQLWPQNTVIFSPEGPGQIGDDDALEMKWPWYRTLPGEVIISGRRLDAQAPAMPTIVLRGPADGYGETGFHPSTLVFPGEGCWEVTGRVGDASLTFVARVVTLPFDPPWPSWLPEGMVMRDTDVTKLPESIGLVFGPVAEGAGVLEVAVTQGMWEDRGPYPPAAQQPVVIHGQQVSCVQGAWDAQRGWRADAGSGVIEWSVNGFRYRVSQTALGLGCEDLTRIAESIGPS